jgi:hypothetical protein
MNRLKCVIAAAGLLIMLPDSLLAQELMIYPAKGQSEKQQEKDKFECYGFAKSQSGPRLARSAGACSVVPGVRNSGVAKNITSSSGSRPRPSNTARIVTIITGPMQRASKAVAIPCASEAEESMMKKMCVRWVTILLAMVPFAASADYDESAVFTCASVDVMECLPLG